MKGTHAFYLPLVRDFPSGVSCLILGALEEPYLKVWDVQACDSLMDTVSTVLDSRYLG